MKKIFLLLILSIILISIGISEVSALSDAETTANDILNKNNDNSKILVVYFQEPVKITM